MPAARAAITGSAARQATNARNVLAGPCVRMSLAESLAIDHGSRTSREYVRLAGGAESLRRDDMPAIALREVSQLKAKSYAA